MRLKKLLDGLMDCPITETETLRKNLGLPESTTPRDLAAVLAAQDEETALSDDEVWGANELGTKLEADED